MGLGPDGTLTVPSSEGEWVPASMVAEIKPGGHYGYPRPERNQPPDLPLVYLPRGIDNSSGGQVFADSDRFGPLATSGFTSRSATGSAFLLLRDAVDGQPQGAVVPLPGEFASGVHRGRMNPKDGQLYVSGMAGWGTYTPLDGCFQRVRYTGEPAQLPVGFRAVENGVLVTFSRPARSGHRRESRARTSPRPGTIATARATARRSCRPSHPGVPGHDPLTIRSAHVLDDGRTLFLELPDIQPVNQLHLRLRPETASRSTSSPRSIGWPRRSPASRVHPAPRPSPPTRSWPTWWPSRSSPRPTPGPARSPGARSIPIEAGKNLTFSPRSFTVKRRRADQAHLLNPDVVPHNWALIKPGTLDKVGDLANKIIAEPDAVARRYIPRTDDVLAYTDLADPQGQSVIYFRAPNQPGRYPYLCTFPGTGWS